MSHSSVSIREPKQSEILAVLIILCIAAGFVIGYQVASSRYNPYCPSEDSCSADYSGKTDRWVITREP